MKRYLIAAQTVNCLLLLVLELRKNHLCVIKIERERESERDRQRTSEREREGVREGVNERVRNRKRDRLQI